MNCRPIKRVLAGVLALGIATAVSIAAGSGIIVEDGDTVAFLGDSITAGGAGHGGYCRLVIHGLKTKGIHARGIFAGVPGNKSSDMLLRLDGVLKHKPDHLFLSAGVNDIWHGDPTVKIGVFQAKPGMGVDFDHYKIYMPQILDRCKAAGTDVTLSTITPITEDPEFKLNKTSEKYNAFLCEQANKRGLPIARLNEEMFARIVELRAAEDNPGRRNMLTGDGVHPTGPGHLVMAKGILRAMGLTDKDLLAVEKQWNSSPKILIVGDRQVNAGGRTGGWIHMLLDGMNAGREMVTASRVTDRKHGMLAALLPRLDAAIGQQHTKYMLLIPPLGDIQQQTPIDDYRKTLRSVAGFAGKNKLKLVVATIPMLNSDIENQANVGLRTYNQALREVCKEKQVALADINSVMAQYYREHPGERLTVGDERLNHAGGKLLAESVLTALGQGFDKAELRRSWDRRDSYTFRYGGSVTFSIPLSDAGQKALQEVTDRFHKLDSGKFIDLGVHLLLEGDEGENRKRISIFDKAWLGQGTDDAGKSHRMAPASADQDEAIRAYVEQAGVDRIEFYKRAYKVGMVVMRKEDPLGRGSF